MNYSKILGILGFCSLMSCGRASQTEESSVEKAYQMQADSLDDVQSMNHYHYTDHFQWGESDAHYTVERVADDSLSQITDDQGNRYADNRIVLTVERSGKQIFRKTFVKSDFKDYMDEKFYAHALLEGMAFDRVEDNKVRFAVSVSYPVSDLYIPLLVTIASDGSYQVRKDEVLDNVVETMDTTA